MLFVESTHCSRQAGHSRGRGPAIVTVQLRRWPGPCVCQGSAPLITEADSMKACPEAGAKQPKAPVKQDIMQALSIGARGSRPRRAPQRESPLTANVDNCLNHHVSRSYLRFLFFFPGSVLKVTYFIKSNWMTIDQVTLPYLPGAQRSPTPGVESDLNLAHFRSPFPNVK